MCHLSLPLLPSPSSVFGAGSQHIILWRLQNCSALSHFLLLRDGHVPFSPLLCAHHWSDRDLACPTKMAFSSQGCTQLLCHPSKAKTSPAPASSLGSQRAEGRGCIEGSETLLWLRICLWVLSHLLLVRAPGQG